MRNFISSCIAGNMRVKNNTHNLSHESMDCSDDEVSVTSKEKGLECPICWESFNLVENVPYVLWCGHTLCKNCILGLQWAVVKCPTLPVQLPLFISCPWCNLLSFRLVYRGILKFPHKNFFLLWMLESMNGDRVEKSHSTRCDDHPTTAAPANLNRQIRPHSEALGASRDEDQFENYLTVEGVNLFLKKWLVFFVHLTAKFPLVIIFLLIVLYAVPASAAVLSIYVIVTVLFALPAFLILYFAYPSVDWLVREIIT